MAHSNINTEVVRVMMTKSGTTPGAQTITSATGAMPSVATLTAGTVANQNLVYVENNEGMRSLGDGWYFASPASSTSVTLIGSDTVGSTWLAGKTAKAESYKESDFAEICASSIDMSKNGAETISVATFCNRNASIKQAITEFGTVTIGGYIDIASETYKEINAAYLDQKERAVAVVLGNTFAEAATSKNYMIAMAGKVSFVDFDLPLDGALAFTAEIKLSKPVQHIVEY